MKDPDQYVFVAKLFLTTKLNRDYWCFSMANRACVKRTTNALGR